MDEKTEKSYKRNLFSKIKSNFILKQIFNDLDKKVSLEIIRYNKRIKKRLNKDINNYKKYLQIIIEIIPKKIYMVVLLIFQTMKINVIIIFILMMTEKKYKGIILLKMIKWTK